MDICEDVWEVKTVEQKHDLKSHSALGQHTSEAQLVKHSAGNTKVMGLIPRQHIHWKHFQLLCMKASAKCINISDTDIESNNSKINYVPLLNENRWKNAGSLRKWIKVRGHKV